MREPRMTKKQRVRDMLAAGFTIQEIVERGVASKSYVYGVAAEDRDRRTINEILQLVQDIKFELRAIIGPSAVPPALRAESPKSAPLSQDSREFLHR